MRYLFLDRKSTRLNSSHTVIYTLSLHDALPILKEFGASRILWGSNFPAAKPPLPELVAMARNALSFLRSEEHTSELQSHSDLHSFPTRRSSDLEGIRRQPYSLGFQLSGRQTAPARVSRDGAQCAIFS